MDLPRMQRAGKEYGRWTPEQDEALRKAAKELGERNWKAIAKRVPGRTHSQCLQRWHKALKPGLIKGFWTPEEDEKLKQLVENGCTNWGKAAQSIAGRTAKQCRERWRNHLNPEVNKGPFTPHEDDIILQSQMLLGNKWSKIAQLLKGRTEDAVKVRWKSLNSSKRGSKAASRPSLLGQKRDRLEGIPSQAQAAMYENGLSAQGSLAMYMPPHGLPLNMPGDRMTPQRPLVIQPQVQVYAAGRTADGPYQTSSPFRVCHRMASSRVAPSGQMSLSGPARYLGPPPMENTVYSRSISHQSVNNANGHQGRIQRIDSRQPGIPPFVREIDGPLHEKAQETARKSTTRFLNTEEHSEADYGGLRDRSKTRKRDFTAMQGGSKSVVDEASETSLSGHAVEQHVMSIGGHQQVEAASASTGRPLHKHNSSVTSAKDRPRAIPTSRRHIVRDSPRTVCAVMTPTPEARKVDNLVSPISMSDRNQRPTVLPSIAELGLLSVKIKSGIDG